MDRPPFPARLVLRALLVLPLLFGGLAGAQESAGPQPLKPAELEGRIAALSTARDGGEESLAAVADYRSALQFRADEEKATSQAADYRQKAANAAADLEKLTAQPPEQAPPPPPEDAPLETIADRAEAVKVALADARAAVKAHTAEGRARAARQAALPDLIAQASADLAAQAVPEAPLATGSDEAMAAYQKALARRRLLEQQVKALEAEQAYLEATPALFSAESGVLTRRVTALAAAADDLQARLDRLRLAAASDEVTRAREDLAQFKTPSPEREIAEDVLELAERHGGEGGLSELIASVGAEVSALESRTDRISKQFSSAKRRVRLLEEVGLRIDPTTGQYLRSQREMLPAAGALRERLQETVRLSAQAQIDLLGLEDRFAELLTRRAPSSAAAPELERLWKARLDGLRQLIDDHRAYIKLLRSVGTQIRELIEVSTEFALFVDERLLWIPSTQPIGLDELAKEKAAIRELVSGRPLAPLAEDFSRLPVLWASAGVLWCYIVFRRRAFRAKLKGVGVSAAKRNCTSFTPTALALLYTALLAAPVPLVGWFLLARAQDCPEAITAGLRSVAGFFSIVIFVRVLTQPDGLLVDHFRMAPERVRPLRKDLDWFIPVMPVFLFLATSLPVLPAAAVGTAAGRLSFMAVVAVLLVFFARLLRPARELVHWQGRPARRFARFCYVLGVVVPAALIVGAAIGYYASVRELRMQALMSVGLILATLFVAALLHRWILVSRRRLAVLQALKRRAAALAEREAREADPGDKPQNVSSLDEVKANALRVVEVEEQTTRLVRAAAITVAAFGLLGIWQPAIPALSALDRVTLWSEKPPAAEAAEKSAAPAAVAALAPQPAESDGNVAWDASPEQVTLQDLAVAIIVLFLMIVAARNIPGLLELAVFRHLNLAPGSSFAFTTSIRYVIVVVGVVLAFARIGIDWGKVQWIAAAITLGVGFGLQEIFANFVAGLIILFERPIRLGDVVTIAGVDGKVTQIRIRATTIRQFNHRELIVPNKEFITGQLVNWTLSDNVLRMDIPVGIAYGSDTELARKLLLEAAAANPRVLDEPEPVAVYENFADSSLAFVLRACVGGVEDMLPAKSELHFAIDQAFREAGIEMAFPQTDIHIRSLPEPREAPAAG